MKTASLTSLLTACALFWAGIACACPPVVDLPPEETAHQHHAVENPSSMLCAHADCDDGDRLQGDCRAAEPVLTSLERDGRSGPVMEADSGDVDQDFVDSGSDPPRPRRKAHAYASADHPSPGRIPTPVQLKDQLTE